MSEATARSYAGTFTRGVVVLTRVLQLTLALGAALVVVGALAAGMNVLAFAAMGVLALVLLAFVGVLEVVARGLSGWAA